MDAADRDVQRTTFLEKRSAIDVQPLASECFSRAENHWLGQETFFAEIMKLFVEVVNHLLSPDLHDLFLFD